MRFLIQSRDLREVCAAAVKFTARNSSIPLLSHALFRVGTGLDVIASDMERTICVPATVTDTQPGEMCLPVSMLLDVAKLNEGVISISINGGKCLLQCGRWRGQVFALEPDGFPMPPTPDDAHTVTLPAAELLRAVHRVIPAIATDDSRYGLNGAWWEPGRIVSTDGHRLHMHDLSLPEGFPSSLVGRGTMDDLKRLLPGVNGDVTLEFSAKGVWMQIGAARIYSRLLEGDFPDYRQVIPGSFGTTARVAKGELRAALKRVHLCASEKTSSIRLELTADGIDLSASNADVGEARQVVECSVEGKLFAVGFNGAYLLEALDCIEGEMVRLELAGAIHPMRVSGSDDAFAAVVMPMRLE